VSPVLANIYLHYALDLWFEKVVKPRCDGVAYLCRYADDCAPRAYMNIYMYGATQEMRVGPSEPPYRRRLQTASSCAG
jgi:RNA-directed DNA polymerase